MKRTTLALASAAVATAACLAALHALREPQLPDPPRPSAAAASPAGEPASRTAAPPDAAAVAPDLADAARRFQTELARAAAASEQKLRDRLLRVGEDDSLTLDARLERYRDVLQAARLEAPDAPIFQFPSMLAEMFLRMQLVQRELAALGPGARQGELDRSRRELGYDDAAFARMQQLDARHEASWQNGLEYMQERERIAASFGGDAREQELQHLRERYFGDTAPTIEREERDGFFRFARPRIYGRN